MGRHSKTQDASCTCPCGCSNRINNLPAERDVSHIKCAQCGSGDHEPRDSEL